MASTVPAVKKGLRTFLAAQSWPAPDVTVRSAPVEVAGMTPDMVILTDVTAPQAYELLDSGTKTERPTLTGHVVVTRSGTDETAIDATRDRAGVLFGVVEQALETDPTAGGVIPGPLKGWITEASWSEGAVDLDGSGGRQCTVRWTLSWGSDF